MSKTAFLHISKSQQFTLNLPQNSSASKLLTTKLEIWFYSLWDFKLSIQFSTCKFPMELIFSFSPRWQQFKQQRPGSTLFLSVTHLNVVLVELGVVLQKTLRFHPCAFLCVEVIIVVMSSFHPVFHPFAAIITCRSIRTWYNCRAAINKFKKNQLI